MAHRTQRKKIDVSEMTIYNSAQRPYNESWARSIASEYTQDALGSFIVSERNGKYYLIDGQHRKAALGILEKNHQKVDCLVYLDLTVQEEADLFLKHNNSKSVKAIDKFLVRETAKDPVVLDILKIVAKYNIRIVRSPKDPGTTGAVQALERVYNGRVARAKVDYGPELLDRTLYVLYNSWDGEAHSYEGHIISGMAYFLQEYWGDDAEYDLKLDKLIEQLTRVPAGPVGLLRKAKGLKEHLGISIGNAMAATVTTFYNKGLRTNKLPEWRIS